MFYRFHFRHDSPTFFNLTKYLQEQGWQRTYFNWWAHFSEKNFRFDRIVTETLEFKHLLAQLVQQYCATVMPETYVINDSNWSTVLGELSQENVWILKPSLLNNGQHIHIFTKPEQIEQHYLQKKRLGGEHVLQRYITNPHLLQGHKYSTRLFVIVSNYAGVYVYPQGYCNVALKPYQPQLYSELNSHLTNEHLTNDTANVVQIPTQRFDFFPSVYRQILFILENVIAALQNKYPQAFNCNKQPRLAIFGFDFINDDNGRVWLLEANHGPCFPIEETHPLQNFLYDDFWRDFIKDFVQPIVRQQTTTAVSAFQKISLF